MAITAATAREIPWWREPTRDQWLAWWAGWLGWTLDAFDFTVFLLIMVPVSKEFGVSLTQVTAVLTVTLWMRLLGACGSGWLEREQNRECRAPLLSIFRRELIGNTLTACWWMASGFVIYYSIWSLFATHLQRDLNFSPAQVATPIAIANFLAFLASGFWGWTADRIGRRWAMIIPGIVTVFVAPLYLLTTDLTVTVDAFH